MTPFIYDKHFHHRPRQRNNHNDDEKVVLRNMVLQEIADDYLGAVGDYDTTSTPSLPGQLKRSSPPCKIRNSKQQIQNTKQQYKIRIQNTKQRDDIKNTPSIFGQLKRSSPALLLQHHHQEHHQTPRSSLVHNVIIPKYSRLNLTLFNEQCSC